MPPFRKKLRKEYHFSVEGETEEWYLKRLQQLVNEKSEIQIVINADSQNNPIKFVKTFKATDSNMIVYHICDMENQNTFSEENFTKILACLTQHTTTILITRNLRNNCRKRKNYGFSSIRSK